MTIEEIIKRQKEHLTKAQIGELIQATERYKQLNASNRASAMRTLSDQYRATRRGLQNTGLAGRKGKLISGREKAARIRANEAYRSYNAGLRQIDNAYAQNRAARMANETARENQLAEIEKIQAENDKEAERINAEYEAWLRKKKAAEDEYKRQQKEIERLRAQQQAQQQQIRERIEEDRTEQSGVVQGNRIQRLAKDKHPQLETSDYARAAQEQAVQRAVNGYKQTQKVFRQQREADAMYDAMHPGSAITRAPHTDDYVMEQKRVENARQLKVSGASDAEVWFADAYGVSPNRYKTVKNENPELIKELTGAIQSIRDNSEKWDSIINGEDESHQVKGIGTVRTKAYTDEEKNKARTEQASAYRTLAIADAAMRIENESVRKLFVMDDAAFDVMYAAALQIYKIRVNQAENLSFDNDRVTGESTTAAYNRLMTEATEAFAPYEAAKRLKDESQEEAFIAGTYGLDENLAPKRPDWLKGSIYSDGHENWVEAYNRGWSADDYEKNADHRVGKYEALVNEWSFINGRTALLYTQNFQVTNDIANIGEWAGHVFGGDVNRNEAYRSFRRKCESKMGVSSEKMDSLLTLSNLMTDEERARYNTILRDGGAEEADKYFEYLYESVLPNRFEQFVENELASQTNTPEERLLQSIVSIPNNLIQGVSGTIHTMTTNVDDPVAARLDAKKYTTAQAMRGAVGSHYGETGNFLYQGVMSMADSTTVALVGQGIGGILKGAGVASGLATKAGSVLGGSLLGATAYTSAYEEAIQRGLSPEKAKQTALANGINEMLFEAVSLDILVGHFKKGGILKVSKNRIVNWVVNTLVSAGVEGSEEVFTDIANRLWDNRINGVFSEELTAVRKYMMEDGLTYKQALQKVNDEFGAQLWESFKAGALSGGVMGGGATFMGMVQNRGNEKLGKGLRQNSRVMNELRNFDFKSEYAQEILTQDKLTNQDVADLFNIMQQELLGQYKSDIQQAVEDGKITQEQADLLKQYEENGVQIVHDGEVVENEDGITVEQMPSVQDAIANLDNAARIQFLNNEEMRSLVQAVGGETAAVIEQSETAEREAEETYQQTVKEINNDSTLSPEQKQKRLEAAERTRQNARSEASKIADAALTNKKGIGAKLETDGNGTVKVGKGSGKVTYDFSTKDNPGHQTVDSMTATEQSALRIAKIVAASRPDVNVKVEAEFGVDENGIDHSNENGYYDRSTNTIHINMSGDNSVLWTLSHELTHHLANTDTEAYTALRTAIETALKDSKLTTTELEDRGFEYDLDRVDPYIAREGNLWDALVAFEREEHGYGKDAEEEVVARCCESFLGFDQFVKDFARKQYKSAKAVNKFIAQMNIDMQRVSEEARQSAAQRNVWNDESPENQILRQLTEIDKIANLWRIAVNAEAKKRQAAREETRASTKDSVKRSDAEYLDLARRYESGDKSVEAELRKQVDAAAKANGYVYGHAYHGTDYYKDITVFKRGKGGYLGSGIYFSDRQDTAKRYADRMGDGGKVYDAFLKIDNPLKVTSADPAQEILRAAYGNDRVYNERVRNQTNQSQFIQKKDITKLQSKGYDGIIWKLERGVETEYSVFDPEQIKSADLITKDDNGNIIPLSERFKTDRTGEEAWKNEDIRYSLKDDVKQTDITEYEHFNEEKYANMSETERIEYRKHIAEMQIRKEARERQIAIDRNRRIRRDLTAMLKRGNDRIVKMLANPTENSHVPVQLAQAVAEYAQRLNELLVADVNYVRDNPPSVEDVKAYIDEHGYNVDANRFVDFYTGRGWLANSGLPMTNWKLNVASWAKRGAPQNVSGRQMTGAEKIIDALNRSYSDKETIDALKAEDPSFNPRGLLVQYDEKGNIVKDETLVKMINGMDSIIQGKHLTDLTEDELRFVLNTMRGVIHTVTEANKVTVQGEQRNVYRESRQMANEVNSATKVFGDKSNKITKFMNRYVIESLGLRRIAKLYSGSDENAVFVKMVDDLNAGALEQERIKQTLRGMFNEVTTKYAKEMDTWYGKNAEWIDTGFGFKITKGMRVSLAMHILNAQNLRNIEKAGLRIPDMNAYRKGSIKEAYTNGKVFRLTKEQAQQIVDNMTEAEKAYFEVAKEFFHKRSGYYINRTSLKLLGYSKAVVKNYFPIQTDDAYRTVKYDDVRQNASVEHPGFLESRKGTANVMYLNDITAVVNRQIDGVAKYAGLAIPMRNWNNIMNAWLFEENEDGEWVRSDDGRAHDVLERRMGYTNGKQGKSRAIIDYVDQFITDLTSPVVRDANENVHAAEFAAKITSNYVKAVLTLNLRVALSQTASVPTAAAEIPWKYLVQSFGGHVEGRLNRNASNDLIDQYTQIFAMRRAGTQTEVSEIMNRKGFADKAEQKLPGLLGWITAMDVAATRRLWYACERWVKGETNIPVGSNAFYEEVARRYERVIQNTQPNFTVLQRSPALRSKSAAARIITMFGTQRMQNAGVFIESLAEVVQTKDKVKRKAAMKKFGRSLSGLITAAIVIGLERALVSALRGRMRPLQDDDKDITVGSVSKYIMGEIGTSLAGSFMYVGELYDFVHGVVGGLADGDSGYETSFALPAAEALSTTIKFFKDKDWQYFEYMRGDHTDHEKWLKTRSFVNELMTVASYVTGLPLANASKTILNGAVPLVQDIVESTKTGELNLYLHQSGKLDSAKTAENYKEWTNLGKKGSVYLAWENRFKDDDSNGIAHRAELLFEDRALSADEKAILLRMSNSTKDNPLTSKDGVVYKEDGTVVVDFTNLDRYRASTMLSDKQYEGFLNLVDMGVAEDVASTAFIQYNVQKKQGSGANDRFRDWLFNTIKNPEDRAKVDMAVVGNTVRVEGTIGYKENGEVYADYSSKEMFDLYTSGKKQQKSDAIISTTETPEAKAKAFADTDNDYHAKGGIVYNDKDKVVADFTSDEAYRASQMGESHYAKYTDAVKQGMSKENAILAVEKHKEFTNDDDKDNATQYTTWVFNTYKSAKDRAIAGAIYTTKPVTIKDGRTYDENGYIYRDYTSAAWYKLSNRTLSSDGTNKRYEAGKRLEKTGLSVDKTVAIYDALAKYTKKSEWTEYLKKQGLTDEQIKIFLWSRGWAK